LGLSQADTFDKVDPIFFKFDAAIVAVTAYAIAENPQPIARHLRKEEVDDLLRKRHDETRCRVLVILQAIQIPPPNGGEVRTDVAIAFYYFYYPMAFWPRPPTTGRYRRLPKETPNQ